MSAEHLVNDTMAGFLADQMVDSGVGFVGVGSSGRSYELVSALPLAAAHLARTRGVKFRVQIGPLIDVDVADPPSVWSDASVYSWSSSALVGSDVNMDAFSRGTVTMGFISGAQIDRWGNVNVTQISASDGIRRLGGALAVAEHCAFARMPVILADLNARTFVEDVDYVSGFGHRRGALNRAELALPGPGPALVITDRAAFDFTPAGMRLTTLFNDEHIDDVLQRMSFHPTIASRVVRYRVSDEARATLARYPLPGIGR